MARSHSEQSRSENSKPCHGEAFFAEAIPMDNDGDCFVAKNAPRNDNTGCVCGPTLSRVKNQ